jgi:hypothetical protein
MDCHPGRLEQIQWIRLKNWQQRERLREQIIADHTEAIWMDQRITRNQEIFDQQMEIFDEFDNVKHTEVEPIEFKPEDMQLIEATMKEDLKKHVEAPSPLAKFIQDSVKKK